MTTTLTIKQHWSIKSALSQIDACAFACEAGPLSRNTAYQWLKGAAAIGPDFWPGQGVYYEVQAEVGNTTIKQWTHFYIVGCRMDSGTEDRFWVYDLSNDPPAPYHYGTVQFRGVRGNQLSLLSGPEREAVAASIEEEDAAEERLANGQFGVGA